MEDAQKWMPVDIYIGGIEHGGLMQENVIMSTC